VSVCACARLYACAGVLVGVGGLARECAFERVALLIQHVTRHHIAICGLSGSTIFFHIFSQTVRFSKKKLLNTRCELCFSLQLLSDTCLILKKIRRDVINVSTSSCKVHVILVGF
jgi:hypothetical protein